MDRIHARNSNNNVLDLVAAKLKRFSPIAQEVLKRFACLGSVAGISTLALVHGETEEEVDSALWEAVRAGLVFRQDDICRFLHDRIQQAAYSLIPEKHRAGVHLRIGRSLLASMTPEQFDEQLFDVANQRLRATLLTDHDEKRVAAIDLRAGRRPKRLLPTRQHERIFGGHGAVRRK
jgi:predicted ATPase